MDRLLQAVKPLAEEDLIVRSPRQSNTCIEGRVSLAISNDTVNNMLCIRLDGGLYPKGDICDWLIIGILGARDVRGALIELKGRHVEKAIEQLEKTIGKLKNRLNNCMPNLQTAIVVSRGGKIPMSTWQIKQRHFIKTYHVKLTRESNGSTKVLSDILI